ncbi:helix-turn-helix transcriptional regulator [Amycolatopsis jejuensis]|uniref:helix-turn-helix transcriptional regulator n=1 Tax=Amycolatopsis jejuensis TaxID=330084 RepID=UPI00052734C2|nr:helix-turn-helix transcriptional regulator [Amycolatopsis jejuensis]
MRDAVLEAARFLAAGRTQQLTLEDVADHVGYSPFHLARAFERQVGLPPGKFLAAQRFQLAKELLLDTGEKVVDICHEVGFSAPGTFTTRFTASVGVSPHRFRLLPDLLSDHPPVPVRIPGADLRGGVVTGRALLSPAAFAALYGGPAVYVGLFSGSAARGVPVSGSLLGPDLEFTLTGVPPGTYRLLACALPSAADPREQLMPRIRAVGAAPRPVRIRPGPVALRQDVRLDLAPAWSPPVLVALPPLASSGAQEWRSAARPARIG